VIVWLHPPHLIAVAALPCESQNPENVILQRDITKENCIRCIIASSKWTRVIVCLTFTYVGVIQQSVYETQIHDIDDLWKRLMQTCSDFDGNIIDAGVIIWDHVVDTLNACSRMNVHFYDSPEHLWNCQCNLTHLTIILYLTLEAAIVFTCIFSFSTFTR